MTTVLFVTNPFYGHAAAALAIAADFLGRGVDVAWVTDKRFVTLSHVIQSLGIPVYTPPSFEFLATEEERRSMHNLAGQTSVRGLLRAFLQAKWGVVARHRRSFFPDRERWERQVADLLGVIQIVRPDVIVTEACISVPIAAARVRLPWAYIAISSIALPEVNCNAPPGFLGVSSQSPRVVQRLAALAWHRAFYNRWARLMVSPHLNILGSIPEVEGISRFHMPTEFVGPLLWDKQVGIVLPDWLDHLSPEKPLVYLTVGTSVRSPEFFRLAVEALSPLDAYLVITTGMQHDLSELPSTPGNTYIARWIPNRVMMSRANVAIIHGAFNTAIGCLSAGVPAVVMGWYIDQGFYAHRFERLGVGIRLPFWRASRARLRSAVETLLTDDSYRIRAREIGSRMALSKWGGASRAADLILKMGQST